MPDAPAETMTGAEWLARTIHATGTTHVFWIDAVLRGLPELENAHAPQSFVREEEGRTQTAYEAEWRAQGRSLHFFHYVRK